MPVSARFREALVFLSVLALTVTGFGRADAAARPGAARPSASFSFHFGRQTGHESEPPKLLVVPIRKPAAQPPGPAEFRPFFHNPLRLRRMADASTNPAEPHHDL